MSFMRHLIDQTVRALGTSLPEDRLFQVEQSVMRGLQSRHAGETVRLYVPKVVVSERAELARRIRSAWDGPHSTAQVAARFGVSERTVQRIVWRKTGDKS